MNDSVRRVSPVVSFEKTLLTFAKLRLFTFSAKLNAKIRINMVLFSNIQNTSID